MIWPFTTLRRQREQNEMLRKVLEAVRFNYRETRDELRTIRHQRSDATRRGNVTKAAKRKAARDAMTAKLNELV